MGDMTRMALNQRKRTGHDGTCYDPTGFRPTDGMDEGMRNVNTRATHKDPNEWRKHNQNSFNNIDKN
jgi:hypothetical protein